jgi:hypothetical protein
MSLSRRLPAKGVSSVSIARFEAEETAIPLWTSGAIFVPACYSEAESDIRSSCSNSFLFDMPANLDPAGWTSEF